MDTGVVLGILLLVAIALGIGLGMYARKLRAERDENARARAHLTTRFQTVVDADLERQRVLAATEAERQRITAETAAERHRVLAATEAERQRVTAEIAAAQLSARHAMAQARVSHEQALHALGQQRATAEAELGTLGPRIEKLRAEFRALDEEANLQSFGFYKPRYDFASSETYQARLEVVRDQQKQRLKDRTAAVGKVEWTVNGSVVEGRKQINQTLKLMLRAFNGECDAAITKVKYNNVQVMEARIRKAREAIGALAEVQQCEITRGYLDLKLEELALAHEYQEKLEQEREAQRRIREQMREEEVAQRELEKAQAEAEREERRYAEALRKAREEVDGAAGKKQQKLLGEIEELQRKLAEAQVNKQRAVSQAQLTRSGHVYVISNVGSFGEHVYKIGMTRRLDPMDRVRELGDASVPFTFDVHAVIYAEDAPGLEAQLHRTFHHRRVNRVNEKKEFFRVSLEEIVAVVQTTHAAEVEFVTMAEAAEYRKTLAMGEGAQQTT
ncbi:DUF4041 domain-containing protein [Chondromyces apiculatus]|uniref:Chromosome segregation ATPase n=1 Tax=Chondromyces apiculatus DSM 436 TaxID=1192034 RepID=A0A017TEU2_9BACT|nr:DUF4041 domain-containing protein [Chondromyces apiculatus]EYF07764.1 Chromosome segregation ATPase [Chondromyces apiculatus DSM 436]